jgi:hypothetical protein
VLVAHHLAAAQQRSALINASHNGHVECERALLEADADAGYADGEGWTALFYAAQLGHANIVTLLLKAGADADTSRRCGWSPLLLASANGHGEVVVTLLRWDADVAHTQTGGYSSLMHASYRGHVDIALLLLEYGADVRQATTDGYTALQHAAYQGHCDLMRVLLDAGANPLQATRYGRSSLHAAKHRVNALQLLCAYLPARGEDIIMQMPQDTVEACVAWLGATRCWTSPLHHIEFLTFERVRALLLNGADARAGDGGADAPTPLSVALARLVEHPTDERARLVVSTVTPWSPVTHIVFARGARRRAIQLLEVGSRLARTLALVPAGQEAALLDVWVAMVLPLAMSDQLRFTEQRRGGLTESVTDRW